MITKAGFKLISYQDCECDEGKRWESLGGVHGRYYECEVCDWELELMNEKEAEKDRLFDEKVALGYL